MRSSLFISALIGLAAASPRPQTLKFKRDDSCDVPEPDGNGPKPPVDTVEAFLSYTLFQQQSLGAPIPAGYELSFSNKQASSNANNYMGVHTFDTYNTTACAALCDAVATCNAFNIYFERDPTVNPAPDCPNPPSFTNVKCTLWGSGVTAETAVNKGQFREEFQVVIAGSNGYTKTTVPGPQPGYDGPFALDGAINAPFSYIGVKYFPGAFDVAQCAEACTATTGYDSRHPRPDGSFDACNFFNVYYQLIDGAPDGTYCAMYTQAWDNDYATNLGQTRGTQKYVVVDSYGYVADPLSSGHV